MIPKWTGSGYPHPKKWAFKAEMPAHLRPEARRMDFGLFGIGYVALDYAGSVLMSDGQRMPTFEFFLTTPGCVIGPRDNQAAGALPWAYEWQRASSDRMLELLDLRERRAAR